MSAGFDGGEKRQRIHVATTVPRFYFDGMRMKGSWIPITIQDLSIIVPGPCGGAPEDRWSMTIRRSQVLEANTQYIIDQGYGEPSFVEWCDRHFRVSYIGLPM